MVDIECLTEEELDKLRDFYTKVQTSAQDGENIDLPHSIDQKLQNETKKIVTKGIKKAINNG